MGGSLYHEPYEPYEQAMNPRHDRDDRCLSWSFYTPPKPRNGFRTPRTGKHRKQRS